MQYSNEIVTYFKDYENGIGIDLDPDQKVAIVFALDNPIDEIFASISNNVFFVTGDMRKYENLKAKFPGLNLIEGNILSTGLDDKSIDFIVTDSTIADTNKEKVRDELKRISSDAWADVAIIEEYTNSQQTNNITDDFLLFFYAGSGYETKQIGNSDDTGGNVPITIYHNPIGFSEEEFDSKFIKDFFSACENYCRIIENSEGNSLKGFLYQVQKALVEYYLRGFDLPECCGSEFNKQSGFDKVVRAKMRSNIDLKKLSDLLDPIEPYYSNFDPYPDEDDDREVFAHQLSNDLYEIYEDIKSNIIVFESGSLYDKQQALWQFRFDWIGHTGDHWSFAVRAIHWKLQTIKYDDE